MLRERLAGSLLLSPGYIELVAASASHRYKRYEVRKRGGSTRAIYHPSRELKALQRWLLKEVITHLPVHAAVGAYRKGCSVAEHARRHLGCRFLLRVDFVNFFESITSADVVRHLETSAARVGEWNRDDCALFASLVCRKGRLTVGAVTSPALSNTICWHLDKDLAAAAEKRGVIYSRYADDLYFSAVESGVLGGILEEVKEVVKSIPYPRLSVNGGKTRHMSRRRRMTVTGVVLPSDSANGVSVGRRKKRLIRALVHRWDRLTEEEKQSLRGVLANARSIEPALINRLVLKFGSSVMQAVRGEARSLNPNDAGAGDSGPR